MSWLASAWERMFGRSGRPGPDPLYGAPAPKKSRRRDGRIRLRQFAGPGDPPPGSWKECHPATASRFKAEVTCPNGHGLTLKGHSVSARGVVRPSVVCPSRDCSFHEFVELSGWSTGAVG